MASPVPGGSLFCQPVMQASESSTATHQERKNPKGDPDILAACRTGNLAWVEELLRGNPGYINQTFMTRVTSNMVTPLYLASQEGHEPVVEFLIQKSANPNISCREDGTTALMLASQNGHTDIVKRLLKANADPNAQSTTGTTALMPASQNGHKNIVELLLDANADPNAQGTKGITALFGASYKGHEEVVKLLLERQGNPNIQADNGTTALLMASQQGCTDVVNLLLQANADPNKKRKTRDSFVTKSPLQAAKQAGHKDIVTLLEAAIENRKKQQCAPSIRYHYNAITQKMRKL